MTRQPALISLRLCDACQCADGLHLVLAHGDDVGAKLLCPACREKLTLWMEANIPLALVSRPLLTRLLQLKPVASKGDNVQRFEALLQTEFASKWEALRKRGESQQSTLFAGGTSDSLKLD